VTPDGKPGKQTFNMLTYHERQPNLSTPQEKTDAQATIQAFCKAKNIPEKNAVALIVAAKEFQNVNKLTEDGKIGPATLAKMKAEFVTPKDSTSQDSVAP